MKMELYDEPRNIFYQFKHASKYGQWLNRNSQCCDCSEKELAMYLYENFEDEFDGHMLAFMIRKKFLPPFPERELPKDNKKYSKKYQSKKKKSTDEEATASADEEPCTQQKIKKATHIIVMSDKLFITLCREIKRYERIYKQHQDILSKQAEAEEALEAYRKALALTEELVERGEELAGEYIRELLKKQESEIQYWKSIEEKYEEAYEFVDAYNEAYRLFQNPDN